MTSKVFNTDCLEYMRTLPDKGEIVTKDGKIVKQMSLFANE